MCDLWSERHAESYGSVSPPDARPLRNVAFLGGKSSKNRTIRNLQDFAFIQAQRPVNVVVKTVKTMKNLRVSLEPQRQHARQWDRCISSLRRCAALRNPVKCGFFSGGFHNGILLGHTAPPH